MELNVSGFTVKDELDFVNVPLLLKIAPAKSFNLVVGLQIGFLVSAKQDVNGTKGDIEGVKSVNTSFSFGAGFNITDEIEIYGRYNIGLVNLNESNSGSSEIKMNTLQFGLGISL
ncbi:MAG: outer membrane beta-barrel protein [Chryseotalea sp.]